MEAKVLPTYVSEPLQALGGAAVSSAKTVDQTAKLCLGCVVKCRGFVAITEEEVKQVLAQDKLFAAL